MKTIIQTASPKILIIGPSWVGDMVMAQSLFIALQEQQSNTIIDVLAPAWSKAIIQRMPQVRQAIDMPLGHGSFDFAARRAIGKSLIKEQYTQAIVLPNSWKSALIPWFAKIPIRTGWKGEARYGLLNDLRHLNKQTLPFMVERFVALAHPKSAPTITKEQCQAPSLVTNSELIPIRLAQFQLSTHKPIIALCPGAEFGPAKQWPAKHYAHVAQHLLSHGWQAWIMGSKADNTIAEEIIGHMTSTGDLYNLCGKTSLAEAIDLLSVADHTLSNDSGLMHVAAALGKPITAVYGATSPAFTPPLSATANILSIPVDCGPCFKRQCPEGHHRCMQDLAPSEVIATIVNS